MKITTITPPLLSALFVNRAINYYLNPSNTFQGQDRVMSNAWNESYAITVYKLDRDSDCIVCRIQKLLKIALKNRKGALRVRLCKRNTICYDDRSINDIINDSIIRVDKMIPHEINSYLQKSGKTFAFFVSSNWFAFGANHTVLDGVAAHNVVCGVFENGKPFKALKKEYKPVIDEVVALSAIPSMFRMPRRRNFQHYVDWKIVNKEYPQFCRNKFKVSTLKQMKNDLGVSFIATLAGQIAFNTFQACMLDHLNLTITAGFVSDHRYNNFGLIIIKLTRSSLQDIILQINSQLKQNKRMIPATYTLSNVYNATWNMNANDIIVSSLPISDSKLQLKSGEKVKNASVFLPHSSAPIFATCLSDRDYVYATYRLRTNEVDKQILIGK